MRGEFESNSVYLVRFQRKYVRNISIVAGVSHVAFITSTVMYENLIGFWYRNNQ